MHADIETAVSIAQLAADFDWQWTTENAEEFYRLAGWQSNYSAESFAVLYAVPGQAFPLALVDWLPLASPDDADTSQDLAQISTVLVDPKLYESGNNSAELTDLFAEISYRLRLEFGSPDDFRPGQFASLRWDRPSFVSPSLVICLAMSDSGVSVDLVNPAYQRWRDSQADVLEVGVDTVDGPYSGNCEPGSWLEFEENLLATFRMMKLTGCIRLRTGENGYVQFQMGYGQISISITHLPASSSDSLDREYLGDPAGWEFYAVEGGEQWKRSVMWPAKQIEYLSMAKIAVAALRRQNKGASPEDVHFDVWADYDANTPDMRAIAQLAE
ncbi:DUF6301 family protein [Nocardia alba]|uniref:TY-Chap N-terminal domain-containing protein n=1 Tax=Nocardia alba TaxID=225051 RepID=A0A4R1G595_9NOCA|nr:DUF6301 family protein [Nocardia alba]TCK00559.1 hypothetical protein DFR71_1565 [Nocardia alba]